jgi:hypothetical protein
MADAEALGEVGAVGRAIYDRPVHPAVIEDGGEVGHHLVASCEGPTEAPSMMLNPTPTDTEYVVVPPTARS